MKDNRRRAADLAVRIFRFHVMRGDCLDNHFASEFEYQESLRRSLLTEYAFSDMFGIPVDETLRPDGDGGRDFKLPLWDDRLVRHEIVAQIKTKTVHTSWAGLRQSGTHLRVPTREIKPHTIYVFGIYLERVDEAQVLRWQWGRTIIRHGQTMEFKNSTRLAKDFIYPFEKMRDLQELLARCLDE